MNENMRRLRDAVVRRDREVEVDASGTVREVPSRESQERTPPEPKRVTKLAPRTFGYDVPAVPGLFPDPSDIALVTARMTPGALVQLIVPSRGRFGQPIDFDALLQATLDTLEKIAGATTTWPADGHWTGNSGRKIKEPVRVVSVFLPEIIMPEYVGAVHRAIARICGSNQEAAAVIIDDRLILVRTRGIAVEAA